MQPRFQRILQLVTEQHVATARPVASAAIAQQLNLSSATVRNAFAELEAMGMLQQPHASAGRIPTTDGFAHYARALLPPIPMPLEQLLELEQLFSGQQGDALAQLLAQVTAQLTGYAVVVTLPGGNDLQALEVHFSNRPEALLAVVVLANGRVEQLRIKLLPRPADDVLDDAERQLRALTLPLREVPAALETIARHAETELARTLLALRDAWPAVFPHNVASAGLSTVLFEPEASDPDFVRSLIAHLEAPATSEQSAAGQQRWRDESVAVDFDPLLARVHAGWQAGAASGSITLLGPARMRYRPALQAVDGVARAVRSAAS
jgi:heat-inducible transcriptional repressor